MKLNGLSVLFLLAALGMGGWALWEQRKGAALEEKLASVAQERDVLRMTANKKLALASKTEVKQDGPEGLGPEHAKALEEEIKGMEKPASSDENPMSAMAKMMKDPAMREVMKSQMRSQVEFMYRDLFDLLGLDAGKQEQLTKLLVDRAGAGMDLGFSMMGGEKISDEERKKKTEAMAAATVDRRCRRSNCKCVNTKRRAIKWPTCAASWDCEVLPLDWRLGKPDILHARLELRH